MRVLYYGIYRRFSKYSASLIIRHPMNNNEIISLKNFGMLRSCDVAELLVTTDTSSEATESEVEFIETREAAYHLMGKLKASKYFAVFLLSQLVSNSLSKFGETNYYFVLKVVCSEKMTWAYIVA